MAPVQVHELTWVAWKAAIAETRAGWMEDAAARVGGTCNGGAIEVRGVRLALVPGGSVVLGWDGATTALDFERRAQWEADPDTDGSFEEFLRYYLGPARTVAISPFLIESVAVSIRDLGIDPNGDPEAAL